MSGSTSGSVATGSRESSSTARSESRSAVGFAFGVTGEFQLYRRLYLVGEVNAHYVFFNDANLFGGALAGVGFRF